MFRRRFIRRERREWLGVVQVTPVTVAVNALNVVTLLSAATMEEFPGARLGSIVGNMFISPATAPAAASGYGVFVGIARSPNPGSGGATYDPELNLEAPFVYWNSVFPQIGGTAAADSNASRWIGYFRLDIGLRTRFRWHDFDTLLLTVKNSNSSAASIQFSFAFRMLVLAGAK